MAGFFHPDTKVKLDLCEGGIMKGLVRIHDKMVDGCLNIYNTLSGYNRISDSFGECQVKAQDKSRIVLK